MLQSGCLAACVATSFKALLFPALSVLGYFQAKSNEKKECIRLESPPKYWGVSAVNARPRRLLGICSPDTRGGRCYTFKLQLLSCSKISNPDWAPKFHQSWESDTCSNSEKHLYNQNQILPKFFSLTMQTSATTENKATPGPVFQNFLTPDPKKSQNPAGVDSDPRLLLLDTLLWKMRCR